MTALTDRVATKQRIVEVLNHSGELGTAQAFYSMDEAQHFNEAVWLGDVTGNRETVTFGTPRSGRNDEYTIRMAVAVRGPATIEEADTRCQQILDAVDAVLFASPRLGEGRHDPALYPGQLDGPNGFRLPTQSAASVAELTIEILAPLRGV